MARDTAYILYNLGVVDRTHTNILGFNSVAERTEFFRNRPNVVLQHNKYWRAGASIKVPLSYDEIVRSGYDYAIIKNGTGIAYYCFIASRTYISNSVTLLNLDVDYVQTYYFDPMQDAPWFVSRNFCSNSTSNILPPAGTISPYPCQQARTIDKTSAWGRSWYGLAIYSTIDIRSTIDPTTGDLAFNFDPASNPQYRAIKLNDVVTSCPAYLVRAEYSAQFVVGITKKMNEAGKIDAISGIYLIPDELMTTNPLSCVLHESGDDFLNRTIKIDRPSDIWGYVPDNDFLLSYDNSYILINNMQGETATYSFEDFSGVPEFAYYVNCISGSPTLTLTPYNLKISDDSIYKTPRAYIVKAANAVSCSWLNDQYTVWLAQTQNSRAAAIDGARMEIEYNRKIRDQNLAYNVNTTIEKVDEAMSAENTSASSNPVGMFLGDAYNALKGVAKDTVAWGANQISDIIGTDLTNNINGLINAGMAKLTGKDEYYSRALAVAQSKNALQKLYAAQKDASVLPPTATGSNAYGNLAEDQQYTITISIVQPTEEIAEKLDMQYTSTGAPTNQTIAIKQYRRNFDYFECPSPQLSYGLGIPSYVVNMFKTILQNGVYIWWVGSNTELYSNFGAPYIKNPLLSRGDAK